MPTPERRIGWRWEWFAEHEHEWAPADPDGLSLAAHWPPLAVLRLSADL